MINQYDSPWFTMNNHGRPVLPLTSCGTARYSSLPRPPAKNRALPGVGEINGKNMGKTWEKLEIHGDIKG